MRSALPGLLWLIVLAACADEGASDPCVCPRGEACDEDGDCVPVDAGAPPGRDLGRQRLDRGRPDQAVRDAQAVDRGAVPDRSTPDAGRDQAPVDAAPADQAVVDQAPPDLAPVDQGAPDQAPAPDLAPPPDQGPVGAPYGAVCAAAAECASTLCVGDPATGQGRCTSACQSSAACPDTDVCLTVDGRGVCVRNETGRPCQGPQDCLEGLCGDAQPAPVGWLAPSQVCVARCLDDRKCPVGYRCDAIAGIAGRVCVPDVEPAALCPNGFREECPPCVVAGRDPLDTTLCLSLEGGGYCACSCASAADCPRGWACHRALADTGDPTRPGACVPMAGLRCAAQVQGGAVQCPGLDCSPDGPDPAAAFCTAACAGDGDCPGAYGCRVQGGQALCVPAP